MTLNWFVAWPVTVPAEIVATWQRDAPVGIRFHHPEDLHITLALLAKHEPTQEKKLSLLLKQLAIPAPTISLQSVIALPQPRRFSTLVWNIENGRLELEKQITKWRPRISRELGAFADASPDLPYMAFARPDRRVSNDERDSILDWAETYKPAGTRLELRPPTIFKWSTIAEGRQFEQIPPAA